MTHVYRTISQSLSTTQSNWSVMVVHWHLLTAQVRSGDPWTRPKWHRLTTTDHCTPNWMVTNYTQTNHTMVCWYATLCSRSFLPTVNTIHIYWTHPATWLWFIALWPGLTSIVTSATSRSSDKQVTALMAIQTPRIYNLSTKLPPPSRSVYTLDLSTLDTCNSLPGLEKTNLVNHCC